MKWQTKVVALEDADATLAELVKDRWFVSAIHPVVSGGETAVFIAACQRSEKKVKKGK